MQKRNLFSFRGWGPTRSTGYGRNEWALPHSKQLFYRKWVGKTPLEYNIFLWTSGYTPFAKLHIMGGNCPQVSVFLYFIEIFIHSIYGFYKKRVGIIPLEISTLVKTSGSAPTQNANLYENEWNPAHSNITFFPNEWAYSLRRITYIGRKLPSSISFLVFCGNFHPLDLWFL